MYIVQAPSLVLHLLLLLLCSFIAITPLTAFPSQSPSPSLPDRFLIRSNHETINQEYFEVTRPLPGEDGTPPPSCTQLLLQHDFANTLGSPPVTVPFSPPSDCPSPWSSVAVEFRASCRGEQYDRIAAIWIDGVEILRTSTAEPTDSGIFWKVRKDVTRYSSLFSRANLTLTVMLENIVDDVFTGIYHVNVSLIYYGRSELGFMSHKSGRLIGREDKLGRLLEDPSPHIIRGGRKLAFSHEGEMVRKNRELLGLKPEEFVKRQKRLGFLSSDSVINEKPADLVIPISDNGDEGFWFQIQSESDVRSKRIEIPVNTYRAVLEIYVSFHSNDEFWYSNPPDSYIKTNNLPTGRGNGAFREVFATVDGLFAGSVVPFPVIFTGGLNPLYWQPVVGIGAFNLPSYDLDLTPFLGHILDGKPHSFGLGVTHGIAYWLIDANLHLWLDQYSDRVMAKLVRYKAPAPSVSCDPNFEHLDGLIKTDATRRIRLSGWVSSSVGNVTTHVSQEFKFKNSIKFRRNGNLKDVEQKIKAKTEVWIEMDPQVLLYRAAYKNKYSLDFTTSTVPKGNDIYLSETKLSNSLYVKSSLYMPGGGSSSSLSNAQNANGSMLVKDHSVLSGAARTQQTYKYTDNNGCYHRTVVANDGKLSKDSSTSVCTVFL